MDYVKTPPPVLKDLNINGRNPPSEDEVLEEQLYLCSEEFTVVKEVAVGVCSWNIDQKKPSEDMEAAVKEWMMVNEGLEIIVVGFQELDMSTNALLREETEAAKPWAMFLKGVAKGRYEVVVSRQLVGLMLFLLISEDAMPNVKHVATDIVRCGVANTIANKGAVGVRFQLYETTFAFATAHLAAHQNEVDRRNKDFERITDALYFSSPSGSSAHYMENELVFLFGDLNYRIELPYERTLDLISSNSWETLLQADQLKKRYTRLDQKPANFLQFIDLTPSFPPSYKYNPGTNVYDTSEKRRVPSWTDRILYKTSDDVQVAKFFVSEKLLASDHRPVAAKFNVKVTKECPVEKAKKETQIREKIKIHGIFEAAISLSESTVQFGEVTYGETHSKELLVTNNGVGVVLIHVHSFDMLSNSKDDTNRVNTRDWISVTPHMLRLNPGQTKPITVKCCIDTNAVRCLSTWHPFQSRPSPILSHLLVISAGQHRCWVETSCSYKFSCFGSKLSQLETLGLTPIHTAYALGPEAQKPLPTTPSVPKELWLLVDNIIKHGAASPELFPEDLDPDAFGKVQKYLDSTAKVIPSDFGVSPGQMSHVLLIFLRSLQEPILPYRCYQACISGQKLSPSSLPAVNYNTFTYIIAFLKHLLLPENNSTNKLEKEILVHTFTSVLLRRDPTSGPVTQEQQRMDGNKATTYILSLVDSG
eukprot:TRINITY_DN20914_c0_g1_i1.p1 TRINITY_DN20914_c0_g1~~TRINITY_DN20914_c0_g1_i1.p1  ORF type:complete len:729 (+),score=150.32 TRINITY_DN20914_c0_g1_i1:81-2189(+)